MDDVYYLPSDQFQNLLSQLKTSGYSCVGPQVRDSAIVYDVLENATQLPWGMRDHQKPGEYRLEKIPQHEAFSFANGPQAIKPWLFKARETLWKVGRNQEGKLEFYPEQAKEKPIAFIGARSCDLVAMEIQDKVFLEKKHVDLLYKTRRENMFIVAVNCTYSSDNCFCVSAGTGPNVKSNNDIAMTEISDGFIMRSGSEKGKSIVENLFLQLATVEQQQQAQQRVINAGKMQTKKIPVNNTGSLRDILFSNLDHPRWDEVAQRCLSCGNCTQVCPTCFCHSEHDTPSLDGNSSEHQREWDSCFTAGHSLLNGKVLREDTRKRYRQWLTHKVGSWFDQFDTSGCVGCGRCVTWCPVGIDITEELAAITGESNVVTSEDSKHGNE
ncbi:MAG: 4Fe-4S dicluster domain-containing protein [Gammaproteobacteria bacterium]|nr:4Fe-4S dicluster domain-containing protein [Gammaproteobacteria bacterium]